MLQVREANQHVNGNPMDFIYKGNSPVIEPNALKAELVIHFIFRLKYCHSEVRLTLNPPVGTSVAAKTPW